MSSQSSVIEHQLTTVLLKQDAILDCVVRLRQREDSSHQSLLIYVVLLGTFSENRLKSYLESEFQYPLPEIQIIPITHVPLLDNGDVDDVALANLSSLDAGLSERWQQYWQSCSDVQQVVVTVEPKVEQLSRLHLTEVLPDNHLTREEPTTELSVTLTTSSGSTSLEADEKSQRLSIAIGEDLRLDRPLPLNLAQALQHTAQKFPMRGITYIGTDDTEQVQTYPELLFQARHILSGLQQLGIKSQEKIIFQFDNNQDYIPAFWACMLGGFVPVPISIAPVYEPGNAVVQKLCNAWQQLEKPLIFTNEHVGQQLEKLSADLSLTAFRLQTLEALTVSEMLPQDKGQVPSYESRPDDLAVLLFTSGSTGKPKGVSLTHQNILSNVAASAQVNQFTSRDISLNWLRLDHVGSLVRCSIRDIYVGSHQVHAPAELVLEQPLRLLDWIERYRVTFAWAPNFALGLINDHADEIQRRKWDLSSLRSMLSVAEAIVPRTAQRFSELLSGFGITPEKMHSAWGMSETCAAVTFSHRYLLSLTPEATAVEVGAPTAGFQMRVVDVQDQLLPENTTGRLQIKGPMVLSGYYENDALNQTVFTQDGWFKTGDLGYLQAGRLTVTGREKDVIIINGLNHYSHEIEAVVETVEGVEVSFTVACGVRRPGQDTDLLLIFFNPSKAQSDLASLLRQIRSHVVRSLGISPTYLIPVAQDEVPKTSIGKLQRLKLKQQFETGHFDQRVKQTDILLANENTIPDWFYEKVWVAKSAHGESAQSVTGLTLILADSSGLGQALQEKLASSQDACLLVEAGAEFSQLTAEGYTLNPHNPQHYEQLWAALSKRDQPITQIVHCWQYGELLSGNSLEELVTTQDLGLYSVLWLVQTLASQPDHATQPIRLQIVASNAQATHDQESVAYEKSPLLGLVKTISKEIPWLDCRHLDLAIAPIQENVTYIVDELQVLQQEREVAVRDGLRRVPRLQPVGFNDEPAQDIPIQPGGFYIISGGLGGVAVEIAQYLMRHYQAHLLLLGRSPLPERSEWSTRLTQDDKTAERIRNLLLLEAIDCDRIQYSAIDICEFDQLLKVVEQLKSQWQVPLNGIFHLAGTAPERLLLQESQASLADTLRPKMQGTWSLHQLAMGQESCLFVSLSSVISLFGGATVGGYAVANSFLESFSQYQRCEAGLQSYCFGSSTWSQIGVNKGYQGTDARRAQGQMAMSVHQGLDSLLIGLTHRKYQLIFGLDGTKRPVQCLKNVPVALTHRFQAYGTLAIGHPTNHLAPTTIVDERFDTPSHCEFTVLPELPLTVTGELDREQLSTIVAAKNPGQTAPRNPVEQELVQIWQTVLDVDSIGIDDNFFELGGTSVLAARLFLQIEQSFGRVLPLATLFQSPTIEQLAQVLAQSEASDDWASLVAIRTQGTRAPLFFVHAGFGDIVCFEKLVRYLDIDRPFYALRPRDLDGVTEPLETIEAMAAHYVTEVLKQQPQGPYLLGGQCTGGVVAYEMARQLKQQGHEVGLLVMLDTTFPAYKNYWLPRRRYYFHKPTFKPGVLDVWYNVSLLLYLWRKIGYAIEFRVRSMRRSVWLKPFSRLKPYAEKLLDLLRFSSHATTSDQNELGDSETIITSSSLTVLSSATLDSERSLEDVSQRNAYIKDRFFETFLRAQATYNPPPYDGDIDFLVSTMDTYVPVSKPYSPASFRKVNPVTDMDELLWGWDRVVEREFRIHPFESTHEMMLDEPYVNRLVEKLQAVIDSCQV
ncbi:hypothetical protein N836_08730 [Leptolyngbya sp. Heron Island J]|uniref:AMP-binding protein n=1 Tax=Leptolyngbya sp. Heron Island J TaxID=1385935 RepID=UPI0003B96A2D|nr:AMP-binding protein [Leptolyngbya sp. Heron Island J]ESA36055.1 hypothetical protein N836_08730 [Leptolyngbya sp. Heron Island J]